MKIKIGFFSFTCCGGCILEFIELLNKKFFDYKEKIDISYFNALKSAHIQKLHIAFIEGAISTKEELERLKKIRKNSSVVVAIGSGAINGWPSNLRNSLPNSVLDKKKISRQLPKILPASKVINIDEQIPGCPIQRKELETKLSILIRNAQQHLN